MRSIRKMAINILFPAMVLVFCAGRFSYAADLSADEIFQFHYLNVGDTTEQVWKVTPHIQKHWGSELATPEFVIPGIVSIISISASILMKQRADREYTAYEKAIDPEQIEKKYAAAKRYDRISNICLISFEVSLGWIGYRLLKMTGN